MQEEDEFEIVHVDFEEAMSVVVPERTIMPNPIIGSRFALEPTLSVSQDSFQSFVTNKTDSLDDSLQPLRISSRAEDMLKKPLPDLAAELDMNNRNPEHCIYMIKNVLGEYQTCKEELDSVSLRLLEKGFDSLEECFLRMGDLEKENRDLDRQARTFQKEREKFKETERSLQEKTDELNQVKSQLVIVEQSVLALRNVLKNEKERCELRAMVKSFETQLKEKEGQIQEFRDMALFQEDVIRTLRDKFAEKEAEVKSVHGQIGTVVAREMKDLADRYGSLLQKQTNQEKELSRLKKTFEAQNVEKIYMMEDFNMQRKELQDAQESLSIQACTTILVAHVEKTARSGELLHLSIDQPLRIRRIQFMSEHPPRKVMLQNEFGEVIQTCQFQLQEDNTYEIVVGNIVPTKTFIFDIEASHFDFCNFTQILVFGC